MIHDEIVRPRWRAKRKLRLVRPATVRTRYEWDDVGAHGKPSEIKMRSNPEIASAIRQAVAAMLLSVVKATVMESSGGALQRRHAERVKENAAPCGRRPIAEIVEKTKKLATGFPARIACQGCL